MLQFVKLIALLTILLPRMSFSHETSYDLNGLKKAYFFIYDGFTALDMTGPQHTIASVMGIETKTIAFKKKSVVSDTGLSFNPDLILSEIDMTVPYILIIPGGSLGTFKIVEKPELIDQITPLVEKSRYVLSICTGAFIVAQTKVANGLRATTHWSVLEKLLRFGLVPVEQRFVKSSKFYFSAGVSAGIDASLRLVEDITNRKYAQAVQLSMEYSPKPHINSGTPEEAPLDIFKIAAQYYKPFVDYLDNIKN